MLKLSENGIVHILLIIILLVGIIGGLYLVQHPTIFKPKAYQTNTLISSLNSDVTAAKEEYNQSDDSTKEESFKKLETTLLKRKEELIKVIKDDPQTFLDNATFVDKKDEFPKELQKYLESNINAEGSLITIHSDDFKNESSSQAYDLEADDHLYSIYLTSDLSPEVAVSPSISIKGVGIDDNVALNPQEVTPVGNNSYWENLYKIPDTTQQKKVGVVRILRGKPNFLLSDERLNNFFTHDEDSIANYFSKISYGRLNYSFDLLGSIDPKETLGFCDNRDLPRVSKSIKDELENKGVDIEQYSTLIYIFGSDEILPCQIRSKGGQGTPTEWGAYIQRADDSPNIIPIKHSEAFIYGQESIFYKTVYIHELGHTLGMVHAGTIDCGKYYGSSSKCTIKEYGDYSSLMGGGVDLASILSGGIPNQHGMTNIDGVNKLMAGFINASNIQKVTESGTYTIYAQEEKLSPGQIQLLAIPHIFVNGSSVGDKIIYYLEYRRPIGYDTGLPSTLTDGASIYTFNYPSFTLPISMIDDKTMWTQIFAQVLRLKPRTSNGYVDILTDGLTFKDEIQNITIKQISHDENSVTVDVQLDYIPIPKPIQTPYIPPTPRPTEEPSPTGARCTSVRSITFSNGNFIGPVLPTETIKISPSEKVKVMVWYSDETNPEDIDFDTTGGELTDHDKDTVYLTAPEKEGEFYVFTLVNNENQSDCRIKFNVTTNE